MQPPTNPITAQLCALAYHLAERAVRADGSAADGRGAPAGEDVWGGRGVPDPEIPGPAARPAPAAPPPPRPIATLHACLDGGGQAPARIQGLVAEFGRFFHDNDDISPFFAALLRGPERAPGDALRLLDYLGTILGEQHAIVTWRAAVLASLGRWPEVARALARDPDPFSEPLIEVARALEDCDIRASVETYGRAMRTARGPDVDLAGIRRAMGLARLGQPGEALAELSRHERRGVLTGPSLETLAGLLVDARQLGEARRVYEDCLRHGVPMAEVCCGLAAAWAEVRPARAAQLFALGLRQPRLEPEQLRQLVVAADLLEDLAALRACRDRALAGGPVSPALWQDLAAALSRRGDLAGAQDLAVGLCAAAPTSLAGWRLRAETAAALGRDEEAAAAWREVAGLDGDDPLAHLAHGWALLLLPHGALGACQAFDRALALAPADVEALQGRTLATEANAGASESAAWLRRLHRAQPAARAVAERFVVAALSAGVHQEEARAALRALAGAGEGRLEVIHGVAVRLAARSRAAAAAMLAAVAGDAIAAGESATGAGAAVARLAASLRRRQRRGDRELRPMAPPGAARAAPALAFFDGERRVAGREIGRSHDGRSAVLTDAGVLHWAPWGVRSPAPPAGALATLVAGRAFRLGAALVADLDAALRCPRVGAQSGRAFVEHLAGHGECFVVGGAVRDRLVPRGRAARSADLDLCTTLAPHLVSLLGAQLVRDVAGAPGRPAGVVSPYTSEFFGLVSFGHAEGDTLVRGLDVTSVRVFGAHEPPIWVPGARGRVLPLVFGGDLAADARARDFTVNALYYCPLRGQAFDPTGFGVADLRRRHLRLCDEASLTKNEMIGWRYLKMRGLDFTADAALVAGIGGHFEAQLARPDVEAWRARALRRHRPPAARPASAWAARVAEILAADGLGGLTPRLVGPPPTPSGGGEDEV